MDNTNNWSYQRGKIMQHRGLKTIMVIVILVGTVSFFCNAESDNATGNTIEVFHKDRKPSLDTLEKTMPVLEKYADKFEITTHLITDPEMADQIKGYNLPGTHFPFAVVINGKLSAQIDNETIYFFDFPEFMHGIGRHEGNWSLKHLESVLQDVSLLLDDNILPEFDHDHHDHSECE
jgi:hypothetical protein